MSIISQFIKEIFKGVKPSWRKLFLSKEFKPILNKCFKKINKDLKKKGVTPELVRENGIDAYIRPVPSKIMNAFKYFEISETRVIIVGQDPYTKVDEAEGLSFSAPVGTRVPPSLRNVYKALHSQGLIDKIPNHGHLTDWARQGVLLLNRYLTRTPTIEKDKTGAAYVKNNGGSTKRNMHVFWSKFTNAVVKWLSDNGPDFTLLLWGSKADEISEAIAEKIASETIDVQTWGHPSPLNRSNKSGNAASFENCTHFAHVNEKLEKNGEKPINWQLKDWHLKSGKKTLTPSRKVAIVETVPTDKTEKSDNRIVVFTDGGCSKNGKKNAKASYAAHFPKKFDGNNNPIVNEYSGMVPIKEANSALENYFNITWGKIFNGPKTKPTNNRGELLAIITAFSVILQNYSSDKMKRPILLVTDSKICMGTINAWIWNWVKKKKDFSHKANPDLIRILYRQLLDLHEVVPTDKLLQASAAKDPKNNDVMDVEWGGLTIIHQNSHLAKKDIPKKGSFEYELYAGNQQADDLCNEELKNAN